MVSMFGSLAGRGRVLLVGALLALAPGCSRKPHQPVQRDLAGPALAVPHDSKSAPAAPKRPEVDPKEQRAVIEALLPRLGELAMRIPERTEGSTCPAASTPSGTIVVDYPLLLSLAATRAGKPPARFDAQGWEWITSGIVWEAMELARGASRRAADDLTRLQEAVEHVAAVAVVRASMRALPRRGAGGLLHGALFVFGLRSGKLFCQAPLAISDKSVEAKQVDGGPYAHFAHVFRMQVQRLLGEAPR
jgi:hypothetical protein